MHEGDADELRQQARLAARTLRSAASTYRVRNVATRQIHYILEHRQAVATNSGLLLGYEGVWLDVTRQTLAEKRLSNAAWKETLSALTMGMAHDFGNMMAGIHSLSESFSAQLHEAHPFYDGLVLIQKNARQASQLIQRVTHLHHDRAGERSYQDLNVLAQEVFELVHKVIPRTIEVKLELMTGQLPLYLDPVEFRQVVINLALNAAEAMPQGGHLVLRSSLEHDVPLLEPGRGVRLRSPCVCLRVADTGHGIDPLVLPTIFDPFFTTKAMNKGSGLGLYNAKLFAEKHGGAITVVSAPGAGATFYLWLPLSDFTEGEQPSFAFVRHSKTILLLGSSTKLVEGSAEFLRHWGFSVSTALNATEARHRLDSAVHRPDGIMALIEQRDARVLVVLRELRLACPHSKMILQIIGCNRDELDTSLLAKADLLLTADLPTETIQRQLHHLFT